MDDVTTMFWISIFSVFGFAYFAYGKKQDRIVPLISGIILIIFPYFISNLYIALAIGFLLIISPLIIRID